MDSDNDPTPDDSTLKYIEMMLSVLKTAYIHIIMSMLFIIIIQSLQFIFIL